jgi:putative addiction module component (TIGR02574 family)
MSLNDIEKMPTVEKIHLMETLWNSLSSKEKELETPQWHKEILEKRAKKLERQNIKMYSLDELKALR